MMPQEFTWDKFRQRENERKAEWLRILIERGHEARVEPDGTLQLTDMDTWDAIQCYRCCGVWDLAWDKPEKIPVCEPPSGRKPVTDG